MMTGESTSERAEAIANTVREGIRQHNLQHPDKGYELQASIGTYTNHIGNHMLDYFMKKRTMLCMPSNTVTTGKCL